MEGNLEVEPANKNLHSLKGFYDQKGKLFTTGEDQLLMKGASLENTEWAFGMCVYTGLDTKIMRNL